MNLRIFVGILIVAGLFAIGCSEDSNPTGTSGGEINVTVGDGLTPLYSWSNGAVLSLSVVRTSAPTVIVWGIATSGENGIASPIRHGFVPQNAVATAEAEQVLEDGIEYRVTVARLDGESGWIEFTAQAEEMQGTVVELDATSTDNYAYYNLLTEQTVDLDDESAELSNEWHLAFRRNIGKLNGGISGPAGLKAVDLEALDDPNGMNFNGVTELPSLTEDDWQEDAARMVFNGWYSYDFETHTVSPTNRLFAFRTADGNYAKVVVTDTIVVLGMGQLGGVGLKYVYNADGGTDLSGEVINVQLNDEDLNNSFFFSFASGGLVEIDDPANSLDWDIWFDGFDVKINSGVHGMGECGVYPIYDENNDFDALQTAPPDMGAAYETDTVSSIFDNWYDYNGETHELTSKGHVYVIMVDDSTYFKMLIENYYKVVSGSPVSAWISFRFGRL